MIKNDNQPANVALLNKILNEGIKMKSLLKFVSLVVLIASCGQQKNSSSQVSAASAATASKPEYVYTSNPDTYAQTKITKIFPSMSDTGKAEVTDCYRRIDKPDLIQVVCKGKVEVLVFGGHRSWDSAACRYNFKLKPNGKYLTTAEPECTK